MNILLLDWSTAQIFAKPIRYRVFVMEQAVPEEMEWDEYDQDAIHALALINDQAVGTARLILNHEKAKIGRMAVLEEWRSQGIGFALLNALVQEARQQQIKLIELHAQVHAEQFYAKLGFVASGEVFSEAGMDHIKMQKVL